MNKTINLYFGNDLSLYKEVPVSVNEFITNPYFIGNYTYEGHNIFPFWKDALNTIFMPECRRRCIVASTNYSTGKTEFCNIALAYMLYLFMCLKNPNKFFTNLEEDSILFALCTPDSIQYNSVFEIIRKSLWFNTHGVLYIKGDTDTAFAYEAIGRKILLKEVKCEDDILGKQLVGGVFQWPIEKEKETEQLYKLYRSFSARVQSLSVNNGTLYGFIFVDIERDFGTIPREYGWSCYNDRLYIIDDSKYDTRIVPDVMNGVRFKERFGVF
jgi:hypothetical protein